MQQRILSIFLLLWCSFLVAACRGWDFSQVPTPVPGSGRCDQSSGTALVSVSRESSNSYIYNAQVQDPLVLCPQAGALITQVRNTSGNNYSLAHGSAGAQFVNLNAGMQTAVWNGQVVSGNWTAQYSGEMTTAPSGLVFQVDWGRP
jgi:hypothetical protein